MQKKQNKRPDLQSTPPTSPIYYFTRSKGETMKTSEGFDFFFDGSACDSCGGRCCIGEPGFTWISPKEIEKLADLLQKPTEEVMDTYIVEAQNRYSLTEKSIGDNLFACIFFDTEKGACTIYEARPEQCRTFPFWDEYLIVKDDTYYNCPGITPRKLKERLW